MSLSSAPRRGAVVLLAAALSVGCAHPGFRASAIEPSASNSDGSKSDGSKSDGSKSDGSKSDGSKSDGSKSDGSSDGSSDSRSETSGTVTTGKEGDNSSSAGLFILTGALLLGATTIVGILLLNRSEPVAYTTRHERGIRLALTRGEGPFVLDVADNLRLPRDLLPTLGEALRRARSDLEPHLIAVDPERGFTTEDGRLFAEKLARALHAEPRLTPYVQTLMDEIAVVVGSPAAP